MDKLKCIIIDDEKLARDIISKYLSKIETVELIGECGNGFDGFKMINELNPDFVFLDIQMPKLTGFEMLELFENPPAIIFTTAFDQYAIKAFEVNAVDYLLKPFSEDRLNEAVKKIKQMLEVHDNPSKKLNALIEHRNFADEYIDRVVIKHNNQIILIPIKDVIILEAQDDYVQIVTKDSKYLKQKTMKYFENNLSPADFIRVHRSYIVNISEINKIEILEKDTHILILKNGTKIPVSRSGYTKLKAVLN